MGPLTQSRTQARRPVGRVERDGATGVPTGDLASPSARQDRDALLDAVDHVARQVATRELQSDRRARPRVGGRPEDARCHQPNEPQHLGGRGTHAMGPVTRFRARRARCPADRRSRQEEHRAQGCGSASDGRALRSTSPQREAEHHGLGVRPGQLTLGRVRHGDDSAARLVLHHETQPFERAFGTPPVTLDAGRPSTRVTRRHPPGTG